MLINREIASRLSAFGNDTFSKLASLRVSKFTSQKSKGSGKQQAASAKYQAPSEKQKLLGQD